MNRHLLPSIATIAASLVFASGASALGTLENPQQGGIEAGIGAITGWHCTSKSIEVRLDGVSAGLAGAGTSRVDTAGVCGGRSDTGFSLLYNYALLRGGTHRVDVYADGVLFGTATFQVGYLGSEFLTGLASAHRILDFPVRGQGTRVIWQQSKQNFVIAGSQALTSGTLIGTYTIKNVWLQDSTGLAASSLITGVSVSGTFVFNTGGTYTATFTISAGGQSQTTSGSGVYTDLGYAVVLDGDDSLVIERGDTLTLLSLLQLDTTKSAALVLSADRTPISVSGQTAGPETGIAGTEAEPTSFGGVLRNLGTAIRTSAR